MLDLDGEYRISLSGLKKAKKLPARLRSFDTATDCYSQVRIC